MNREELVKEIAKSTKLSQKSVSEVLSATVESIQNTVKKGDKVTLVGFGTFESRRRAASIIGQSKWKKSDTKWKILPTLQKTFHFSCWTSQTER